MLDNDNDNNDEEEDTDEEDNDDDEKVDENEKLWTLPTPPINKSCIIDNNSTGSTPSRTSSSGGCILVVVVVIIVVVLFSTFRVRSSFHLFGGEIRVDVVVVGIRNNCFIVSFWLHLKQSIRYTVVN